MAPRKEWHYGLEFEEGFSKIMRWQCDWSRIKMEGDGMKKEALPVEGTSSKLKGPISPCFIVLTQVMQGYINTGQRKPSIVTNVEFEE
jgi:hypothetical protein